MYRRPVPGQSQNLYGNARFEGYTKELADHLSKELNLEFEIRPVKDGQYGVSDPNVPGGWTGVIGELVRNEADIAISPLTINAQRYLHYLLVCTIDILFSSNHNIHKSSCGLCFWASDPLIDRFY